MGKTLYDWSDQNLESLKAMHQAGALSLAEISKGLFGTSHARGAVIRKIKKLKLGPMPHGEAYREGAKLSLGEKRRRYKQRGGWSGQRDFDAARKSWFQANNHTQWQPMYPLRTPLRSPPASGFNCTLAELKHDSCRFPIGDPQSDDFRFCGTPVEGARVPGPYCPTCRAIAFEKAPLP